jgi:phage-related protein
VDTSAPVPHVLARPPWAGKRPAQLVLAGLLALAAALALARPAAADTHLSGVTYTGSATWTSAGSPYILDGGVTVASGATLTIQPGVIVKLNGQFRELNVNGTLLAQGTASAPIVFTSIKDDSVGGDSNGDGSATQPAPGQWYDIAFGSSSTTSQLQWVDVRYGGYGSGNWNYGALSVNGSVTVTDSTIHDNQMSGIKSYTGNVTVDRSTIAHNGNGISLNMASLTMTHSTVVANSNDGIWFNLISSYNGVTSSIMYSDVKRNGGDGIEIGVERTLPVAKWPHGNYNNIFDNVSNKQIYLGGYHPATTPQYNVDWKNNFWGDKVYYWHAPALCLSYAPYSPGHLAYSWSHPAPGPGGLVPPPDGPLPWVTYLAGTGNNVAYCAYDRFKIGPDEFSPTYLTTAGRLPLFATEQTFAPELHYDTSENFHAAWPGIITDNYTQYDSNRLYTAAFSYLAASDPSYLVDDLSLSYLGSTYPTNYPGAQATSSSDYIDEINNYEADAQRLEGQAGNVPWTEAHFVDLDDGGVVIEYWFFYYYNGDRPLGIGNHEGDWERIQVHLNAGGQPISATYSQHTGGERCDWIHVPRTSDGRPIVYVGTGSHANFFSPGHHEVDGGAFYDDTDGNATPVTPYVYDVGLVPQPRWLDWPGKWGASMGGDNYQQPSPQGPKFHTQEWYYPDTWESNYGCTEGQTFPYRAGAAKAAYGRPPLPRVTVVRRGKQVVVRYAFRSFPSGRTRHPVALMTSVDPAGNRYPPLTYTTKIGSRTGTVTRQLGLGRAPFKLRVAALARDGTRSKVLVLPLR